MVEVVSFETFTTLAARRWWNDFDGLFKGAMTLIENTADYLDNRGRRDALALSRSNQARYTSTSMHMTTLLMQLASWLLLARAFREKELNNQDFTKERRKLSTDNLKTLELYELVDMPAEIIDLAARINTLLASVKKAHMEYLPKLESEEPRSISG